QLPLQEALYTIANQIPQPTKTFFGQLRDSMEHEAIELMSLWEKNVDRLIDISSLGKQEQEILKQFGRTLGKHDFQQQQKHIHLTITHLDREMEDARDHASRYGKMAKSLGFLCGLFIVLLLI